MNVATINSLADKLREYGPLDRTKITCEMIIFSLSIAFVDGAEFGATPEESLISYASVLQPAEA